MTGARSTSPDEALPAALHSAVARLAAATQAEAVVLFGSRARGDAGPDSDWDLCVVVPDATPPGSATPLTLWPLVADLPLAIQVVPIRHSVFEATRHDANSLSHEVVREGMILQGSLAA